MKSGSSLYCALLISMACRILVTTVFAVLQPPNCEDLDAPPMGLYLLGDLGAQTNFAGQSFSRTLSISKSACYPFQCVQLFGETPPGIGPSAFSSTNGTTDFDTNSFLAQATAALPMTVTLTLTSSIPGVYLTPVTLSNGPTLHVSVVLTNYVLNKAPQVAIPISDQTNTYGSAINFIFAAGTFLDPDPGQTLSYTASNLPPGIVFDGPSRTFSGTNTVAGNYLVTVTATDNGVPPLSTNAMFLIYVLKSPLAVTANDVAREFGVTNPPLAGTIVGSTNNDIITATFTTTAGPASRPGAYPIIPELSDPDNRLVNYNVRTNNGVLTVLCATNTQPLFMQLKAFTSTGNDGQYPRGSIILGSDGALYGTTVYGGGGLNAGTVFKLNTDGTGYQRLINFCDYFFTNGNIIRAGLLEGQDGRLYGTAAETTGGAGGTVFRLNKDGSGFAVLHNFVGLEGSSVGGTLIQASDGFLYGTSFGGGSNGLGTIFRLATHGASFQTLFSFPTGSTAAHAPDDGVLEASDGLLYGVTPTGGSNQVGTLYRMNKSGSAFTVLKHFTGGTNGPKNPRGVLVEGTDGALYGTTEWGADTNSGSVQGAIYRINKDGSGFTTIHRFSFSPGNPSDGSAPYAGLVRAGGGVLVGTTSGGGSNTLGTIFRINEDGTDYRVLWNMTGSAGGRQPFGLPLIAPDGALYGVTYLGGNGLGNVFALTPPDTRPVLLQTIPGQTAILGRPFTFTVPGNTFSNSDIGQNLSCIATNLPPGVAFESATRTFSGIATSTGSFQVEVTALDNGCQQLGTNVTFSLVVENSPPTLYITRAGPSSVTISWPSSSTGFALQQNTCGVKSVNWSNVTETIQDNGATKYLIVNPPDGNRFFRLVKP